MSRLILPLLLCFSTFSAWATPGNPVSAGKGRPHLFMENRGQIHGPNNEPLPQVLYQLAGKGINVSLTPQSIHYTFVGQISKAGHTPGGHKTDSASAEFETLGMDVALIGANPSPKITAAAQQEYYENHYTSRARQQEYGGIAHIRSYARIVYHDVYQHIDWEVYVPQDGSGSSVKYDFVVHPGGDPSQIKLKYCGAATVSLTEDGSLEAGTVLGGIKEAKPYSYIRESGKEIASKYILRGDTLSFALAKPVSGTLVIDPQVIWATYFGGSGADGSFDLAGYNGDAYICGTTKSVSTLATFGSFKAHYSGADDAFLARFSSSGNLVWATYFGGTALDRAMTVAIDPSASGSIYLCGYTFSNDSIATTGSHQVILNGGHDAFMAKFSLAGALIRASYYGGPGTEIINAAACDAQGNLYVTGTTTSTTGMATTGSFSTSPNECFIARFNAAGVRQWGTYFGGESLETINDLSVNGSALFITGFTRSNTGIASPGSHQSSKSDTVDAFLAKFGATGNRIWATYYGGLGVDDGQGLSADDSGNVYMCGITSSQSNISSVGAHQPGYGGDVTDAFVAKFNDIGIRLWGTYYGGSKSDAPLNYSPAQYATQRYWSVYYSNGKVWVGGTTTSTNAIATPGSYQDSLSNAASVPVHSDAMVAKFDASGNRLWTSYFGGPLAEITTGISGDNLGNVYLTGGTVSSSGVATSGAHQTSLNGSSDAFLVRIFDSLSILRVRNVRPYCINDTFSLGQYITANGAMRAGNVFRAELSNATGAFNSPTTIGTAAISSAGNIFCTLPPGISGAGYKLRIVSTKPVMISDTVAAPISNIFPVPVITRNGGILSTGTFSAYQWYKNGVLITSATSASYKPTVNGPYTVTVTSAGGCKGTSTVYNMVSVGIAGLSTLGDVNVYPNPTYDQLNIDGAAAGTQLVITSLVGQQVAELILQSGPQVLSISHAPAGVYMLTLRDREGGRKVIRILKQ